MVTDYPLALTSLLQTNLQNHKTILAQKIAQIDQLTSQIQELSAQQAAEQARFDELQTRIKTREEREKKIDNLKRILSSSSSQETPSSSSSQHPALDPSSLSSMSVQQLRSLTRALERNNAALSAESATLRSRSLDTERLYRRVIGLCTGVPEKDLDSLLPGLVAAVESEAPPPPPAAPQAVANGMTENSVTSSGLSNLRVGRVRDFLALVDGVNAVSSASGQGHAKNGGMVGAGGVLVEAA